VPPRLPPPDPSEPGPPADLSLPGPSAVFMSGPPGPDADRLADAILTARPGLLFVSH
jgi:hypothetical protein